MKEKKNRFHLIVLVLILYLISVFGAGFLYLILKKVFPDFSNIYLLSPLLQFPFFVGGYIVALRHEAAFQFIKTKKGLTTGLILWVAISLFWGVYTYIITELGFDIPLPQLDIVVGIDSIRDGLIVYLLVGVLGPVIEELFFRGAIFGILRKGYSFYLAAGVSSFLFGISHGLLYLLPMFIFGYLLCWLAEKYGSLDASIFIHILNNVLSISLALQKVS